MGDTRAGRGRKSTPTHWFTLQMPAAARAARGLELRAGNPGQVSRPAGSDAMT